MREGLRSSSKLLAKADKGEASPAKVEVNSTEERGCCLSDEKVPKLIGSATEEEKLVSAQPEETDGSKHEECGVMSDIGEDKIAIFSNDRKKRKRIDGKGESEDDNSIQKEKLREDDVVDGKPQVVRRVSRSMSAAKFEGKNESGQINGGFVADRTRGKIGSDKKRVEVEKGESDHLHYSSQSGNMANAKLEHNQGRSPKSQESNEFEKKLGGHGIEKGEIDQSSGQESHHLSDQSSEEIRPKLGRPPKSQERNEFEKKLSGTEKKEVDQSAGQERHHLSDKSSEGIRRKRGRPPKSQERDEFEKKLGTIEKEEIDQSAGQESHHLSDKSSEEIRRKCGRPPKSQERDKFEKKLGDTEKEEIDQSAGQESDHLSDKSSEEIRRKHGRPPKSQERDEFEKKLDAIDKGEIDQSADQDNCHLNCKSSEEIKHKRGRAPKSQEIDEFEKKLDGIEKEEIDQSSGQESHHLNSKSNKQIRRKRGRPPKSQESDEFEKKLDAIEKGEIDQSAGQESHHLSTKSSKEIRRKRGRPPKSQQSDEFQKKWGDVEMGEIDQSADRVSHQFNNKVGEKIKQRRGRPPKAQQSDGSEKTLGGVKQEAIDISASQETHQPNNEGINKIKPRRGRPPKKAQKSNLSEKKWAEVKEEPCDWAAGEKSDHPDNEVRKNLKQNLGRPRKLNKAKKVGALRKKKRGRPSKDNSHDVNHNVGKNSSVSEKRLGKEYNMNLSPVQKIKHSNNEKDVRNTKQKAGEMSHSRSERQAVRDKIVKLLLGAGWEIEHRPRNGRAYMDAVYVNPEGRTHWSVTLAYRVLKQHYEGGGGDSNTHNSSFKFTPIPEEELSILTKVFVKERSDKNKKKKKWKQREKGEKTAGAIKKKKWKLHKRKLGAVAGASYKMLKGRKKLKTMHGQDGSTDALAEGTTVSVRGRKRLETHGRKRCSLMARKSQDGTESDKDGYMLYNGKRTVLAWMIDLGTVPLDGKVQYLKRRKTRAVTKGSITTNGIQCDCCNKTFTNAEFEIHAGGKSCQPLENIYLETGSSLLQCQLDSWHKEDESAHKGFHFVDIDGEDPNDDTCGICGDGGDLICCDSCPSTFHQSCLEIRKFPSGLWHCIYCLCKFCGMVGVHTCQRDDNKAALSNVLFTCRLCEDKYHQSCVQEKDIINADPGFPSFCGKKCQELYERLQMLFGVKHELEEGFSWTFVRRFDVGSDISLRGMSWKVDCNSKVAVALQIMDECFVPMVDHRSRVNLIRNIVYSFGSNFNRLNYSGFFTAVLERGDEMIAAASIRIHGSHLAEMPFIGTRYMYRRQGMCRRLLSAIEMALCSLNVEKLVIPAISELMETWTSVFGFRPLEGSDKQMLRKMNMMMFPGVDMLQKPCLKHQFTEENMHPVEGSNSIELGELHTMEEMTNDFGESCSAGRDFKGSSETGATPSGNIMNEDAAVESGSVLDGCSNDISDITTQNASGKIPVDQSVVISNHLDVRIGIDSFCDACDQTGDEMLNNSDKRCSPGFDLKDSSETGVPHASNINEPAAVGYVLQPPDGCSNERTDDRIQDVINEKCHDQSDLVSEDVEHNPDSLVHNTAEIIGPNSQELVSEYETELLDLNVALCESKVVLSTSPIAHQSAQDSLDGCPIDQNLSSMGNNTHCMALEGASGSCRVTVSSACDLKDESATAQNGTVSFHGCLVSEMANIDTESSMPPGSDTEIDVIQRNSESMCGSSSAPDVILHCASGGGNSCGASEVMILSNQAN